MIEKLSYLSKRLHSGLKILENILVVLIFIGAIIYPVNRSAALGPMILLMAMLSYTVVAQKVAYEWKIHNKIIEKL